MRGFSFQFSVFRNAPIALLAVTLLGLTGCALFKPKPPPPRERFQAEDWEYHRTPGRKITTAHYELCTTLKDDMLLGALPDVMESIFSHYHELVPAKNVPSEKLKVYLFATRSDFERFTRALTGPRAREFLMVHYGGYSEGGTTVIEYNSNDTTFPILAHEGLHQYLQRCAGGEIPAWLHEGLAVYCEGMRWDGARIARFDPWNNPFRYNTLAAALVNQRTFPLTELLDTHAGAMLKKGPRSTSIYYAQLWGLVLFLCEGENGKYAPGFARMRAHVGQGDAEQFTRATQVAAGTHEYGPGEALFRSFITTDLDAFEREYEKFLRQKLLNAK
jgi:hypothetical protein